MTISLLYYASVGTCENSVFTYNGDYYFYFSHDKQKSERESEDIRSFNF